MTPKEFTQISKIDPNIRIIANYATSDNFIGEIIDGYKSKNLVILNQVANALSKVQKDLLQNNLSLQIFDAFRPEDAVAHFHRWRKSPCEKMKEKYYPNFSKEEIFEQGMIALRSSHSRGVAVDLGLYDLKTGLELEMGTIFDFFDQRSFTFAENISQLAKNNRLKLLGAMQKYQFINYDKEWWHFSFNLPEAKDKYWNFDIL